MIVLESTTRQSQAVVCGKQSPPLTWWTQLRVNSPYLYELFVTHTVEYQFQFVYMIAYCPGDKETEWPALDRVPLEGAGQVAACAATGPLPRSAAVIARAAAALPGAGSWVNALRRAFR